jgi:hypothetical protein
MNGIENALFRLPFVIYLRTQRKQKSCFIAATADDIIYFTTQRRLKSFLAQPLGL